MATNTTTQLKPEEDVAGPFLPDDAVLIRDLNFSYGDRQVKRGSEREGFSSARASARAWWLDRLEACRLPHPFSPRPRTRFLPPTIGLKGHQHASQEGQPVRRRVEWRGRGVG